MLGAGVSHTRGVPLWPELVQRLWKWTFGARSPDYRGRIATRLIEARRLLAARGWDDELLVRLDLPIHPFELQFAMELIHRALEDDAVHDRVARRLARPSRHHEPPSRSALRTTEQVFTELLRTALYSEHRAATVTPAVEDTLSVVADLIREDQGRRIVRVISFNADDLIEREVNRGGTGVRARAISRSRDRLVENTLPVYHVHGFLPMRVPRTQSRRRGGVSEDSRATMVFTDAQYWGSIASPLSFANRAFVNALHDSQCIFIGLSMTDIDVIRWLGTYAYETGQEWFAESAGSTGSYSGGLPRERLGEHYWIRRDEEDPGRLLSRFLRERGVVSIPLASWSPRDLRRALGRVFAVDQAASPRIERARTSKSRR